MDPQRYCRLHDLWLSSPSRDDIEQNYFAGLDPFLDAFGYARDYYDSLESRLELLDDESWRRLRAKAIQYASRPTTKRRWEQLITILNEAAGYELLQAMGCRSIAFIEEPGRPDLLAFGPTGRILVEVKTLNRSDESLGRVRVLGAEPLQFYPAEELLTSRYRAKFAAALTKAAQQLTADASIVVARRVALLVLNFDPPPVLWAGQLQQVTEWAAELAVPGIDVVLEHDFVMMSVLRRDRASEV